MNRVWLYCVCLTALLFTFTAQATPSSLRVMSFNVRYNTTWDGDWAWPHRKDLVSQVIQKQNPHVLGVQETTLEMLGDLEHRLKDYSWVGIDRSGTRQDEFNPIFYRHDLFELEETDTFWLSTTPEVPGSRDWGTSHPRIVTWAKLTHRATQKSYVVLNTHFDHLSGEARKQSAQLIIKKLQERFGENPLILMGDFNDTSKSPFYQVLHKGSQLFDAIKVALQPHKGPQWTFRGFFGFFKRRLDYIFVSRHWRVKSHSYLTELGPDETPPSDHLPVVVDLEQI